MQVEPLNEVSSQETSGEVPREEISLLALQGQVRNLQLEIGHIRTALARTGIHVNPPQRGQERQQAAPPRSSTAVASTAASVAAPPSPSEPLGQRPWERIQVDWELVFGGNWMARIGIVALIIGMGFFLKLAIDNEWIGETGQVALGLMVGVALLGAGEYWQKRYTSWAQALTGGGIAILYLSIFAAFSFYSLIEPIPAFGFMALVTLTAGGLAIRYESMAIAILGIIGGFATPILLQEHLPEQQYLLAYVLVLDLGVLGLATLRNWQWFTLLALIGSLALFGMWAVEFDPQENLLLGQVAITLIFLVFVGATTLFHVIWRRGPGPADQLLMILNAGAYFGISYGLLWDEFRPWIGGFTLLLALFYGGVGYLALKRSKENVNLSLMSLGIALVFVTIAAPVQLSGPWISVAWAVEGTVLIWLSFALKMWQLRWFGVGVFAIFVAWLLFIDTPAALTADIRPLFNIYMPAYLVGISATFVAAYILRRHRSELEERENRLFPSFLVAGTAMFTIAVPVQVGDEWIAFAWAVEAVALVWLSFRLGIHQLRMSAIGVLVTLGIRLLVFDTFIDLEGFRLMLNYRMMAFASGVVALYVVAFLLGRNRDGAQEWEKEILFPIYLLGASFLTLYVLSAEVIASVDSGIVNATGQTAEYIKSLGLSLLWAIYAIVGLAVGIIKRWRMVRLAALALLAIPILKPFLVDSFELERGYRVAAFLSLGAILLAGGFFYQRYSTAIRGFLFDEQQSATTS